MALMFLNGEGMRGGSAHEHIAGSAFLGEIRTAPDYRFLAFGSEFPGLLPVGEGGTRVLGELYDVPMAKLRRLLRSEPEQLELSVVALSDGRLSFGMVVRAGRADDAEVADITEVASWRLHLARLG
jgi:gamma-glutamylcyclotransferase (GGCT)/AIG2-like uncharacterized protein YtfP